MGIFSKLSYNAATGYPVTPFTNLFSPSTLALAVFPDVDTSLFPVDAGTALTVPAVARGIQIFSSVGSRLPLVATDNEGNAFELPLLNRTQGAITPQKRTASIIQDLIFYNHAVVEVERDANGYVQSFSHVPIWLWSVDSKGNILVDGKPVPPELFVYIPSLLPAGFLEVARDSVRQYRNITQTINNRTATPEPVIIVAETEDVSPTEQEIDDAIVSLTSALQSKRGGIVYQPKGLEIHGFGGSDSANTMMLEARNAVRVDISNFLGVSAALLDGNGGGNADVYQNAVDERNETLELSLKTWTEPIADRLSQDDVTPPGVKISVDYSSFRTQVSGKTNHESTVPADV